MAMDGLMLHTAGQELQFLVQAKIGKIQNISNEEILFHLHTRTHGTCRLVFNIHPNTNRMYLLRSDVSLTNDASSFVMFLRKYLSQGYIQRIEQCGFDRIVHFVIKAHNEFGDTRMLDLYAELMGKYANLILVGDGKIMDAARRIPVFENSKRLIHPGALYTLPEQSARALPDQVKEADLDLERSLVDQIQGFSPLIASEFVWRMRKGEKYQDILQEVLDSRQLYVYDAKNFHVIEQKHLQRPCKVYPLMEGLNHLYTENEKKNRIQQTAGDVIRCVDREYKRLKKKIPRLEKTLAQADKAELYREYGDLLFAWQDDIEKEPVVTVPSFTDAKEVQIPLDMRYSIKDNANLYYKKYRKLKRSESVLKEQIAAAQSELDYFAQLKEQLVHADTMDAMEIKEELEKNKYMKPTKRPTARKGRKVPNVLHLKMGQAEIYVGKNNLQNQYITHTLSRKEDLWFHVKDYHGAHVLLKSADINEELIRMCAMLAAWFSKGAHSSSVPVDYTHISQLKKVPGAKIGLVTMKRFKTIYIDPEESMVEAWIKAYKVK